MSKHEFLVPALTGLAKLQLLLKLKGGFTQDGQLFEQILKLQDGILKSFGLPIKPDFEKLLWFDDLPTQQEVAKRIENLHKAAAEYLLTNAKPDLQILTEALQQNQDPLVVLPDLKITTHSYTLFVYNKILLAKQDTVENVLQELKLVNNPSILNDIGNLEQDNLENPTEVIKSLKQLGVKYIDSFLFLSTSKNEMNQSNQLIKFLNEINGKVSFKSEEEKFTSLANCLMNYLALAVGKNVYRITECEFYYSEIDHADPYVHCGEEQLSAGKLYLNKVGGLDITFGNANIPSFGGILIRGIRNLKTNEYISQVQKIVSEVFVGLGNIITGENGIYLRELMPGQMKVEQPIKSSRIGLTKKAEDNENYIAKPYRYIVELNPSHKFKDKEKIIKQLLTENKISAERAKEILGYNLK